MGYIRCMGGSNGTVVHKGTSTPSSALGDNGQVYLQTIKGVKQDFSTFSEKVERDMRAATYKDDAIFAYTSGPYIGAQLFKQFDLTNVDSIKVTLKTTAPSYDNYATERFSPILIIENTENPATNFPANTSIVSANGETYKVNAQGDSATFIADVSELTGNYWIVLSSIGATSLWSDLYLCSSTDDEIVCDTLAKVNGAWQDLVGTDIDDIGGVI